MSYSVNAYSDVNYYSCYEVDKTIISMFEILEPGGVSFGQIQHLRDLNSIALGYLNFTAGLT